MLVSKTSTIDLAISSTFMFGSFFLILDVNVPNLGQGNPII